MLKSKKMSLFSNNIIEDPWVGMVYKFWNCTNPNNKDVVWRDAFNINFSKTKLRDSLKDLLLRDGRMKLSQEEFDDMNNVLNQHAIRKLNDIYKFIILICLVVPTLSEENLSNIFTSCLKQTKLRNGDNVTVSVKFPEKQHTFVILHVNTTTPQRIEITLKRK